MRLPKTRREAEIWRACDDLHLDHKLVKNITGDKIMAKLITLGFKRGCPNEIYKYRRTWWELRGIHELEAKGLTEVVAGLNLEFTDPVIKAVAELQVERNKLRNLLDARNKTIRELRTQLFELLNDS